MITQSVLITLIVCVTLIILTIISKIDKISTGAGPDGKRNNQGVRSGNTQNKTECREIQMPPRPFHSRKPEKRY